MLLEVKATEFSKVSLTLIVCYFLIIAASQLMSQKLKTTYKASTSKVTDKKKSKCTFFLKPQCEARLKILVSKLYCQQKT